jgi:hypothetical protein
MPVLASAAMMLATWERPYVYCNNIRQFEPHCSITNPQSFCTNRKLSNSSHQSSTQTSSHQTRTSYLSQRRWFSNTRAQTLTNLKSASNEAGESRLSVLSVGVWRARSIGHDVVDVCGMMQATGCIRSAGAAYFGDEASRSQPIPISTGWVVED